MTRILIIDDDHELCELLSDYLRQEGYQVCCEQHGESGANRALAEEFDLAILDVMLPGLNGFDVLKKIRSRSQLPVIMLTARGEDIDRIVGLELGADDYLPKPFNPRELLARIRAVQRRSAAAVEVPAPSELLVGDLRLNPARRSVHQNGQPVELTSVEFTLLEVLLRRAGQVINREELVESALGRQLTAYDRSIDVHISALRKKLGHLYAGSERIKAVRGIGYLYSLPAEHS